MVQVPAFVDDVIVGHFGGVLSIYLFTSHCAVFPALSSISILSVFPSVENVTSKVSCLHLLYSSSLHFTLIVLSWFVHSVLSPVTFPQVGFSLS